MAVLIFHISSIVVISSVKELNYNSVVIEGIELKELEVFLNMQVNKNSLVSIKTS